MLNLLLSRKDRLFLEKREAAFPNLPLLQCVQMSTLF